MINKFIYFIIYKIIFKQNEKLEFLHYSIKLKIVIGLIKIKKLII